MPTLEDGIREYDLFRNREGVEHLKTAKSHLEYAKNYPSVTDMSLIQELLDEVDRKLAKIQV